MFNFLDFLNIFPSYFVYKLFSLSFFVLYSEHFCSFNNVSPPHFPRTVFTLIVIFEKQNTANGFTAATIGFFLNYYLLSVVGLDPGHITVIQIVTQIFNAISDPVIGIVSDRTETRYGRRQPYILFSALAMPLTYFLFFTSYSIQSKAANLALYLMLFVLFYLAQTLFNVPHMALVMEITKIETEKNNFILSATFFFAFGNLVGFFI